MEEVYLQTRRRPFHTGAAASTGAAAAAARSTSAASPGRFYGAIQWVPVTKPPYCARDVHPVRRRRVLPADVAAIDAYADGTDQSIVDSRRGGLVLPKRAFDAAVATLSAAAPGVPSVFWKGEACVDASKTRRIIAKADRV